MKLAYSPLAGEIVRRLNRRARAERLSFAARRELVRVRRHLVGFGLGAALLFAFGVVGKWDLEDQLAASAKQRDAALVLAADAQLEHAFYGGEHDCLMGFTVVGTKDANPRDIFDALRRGIKGIETEMAGHWK